MSMEQQISSISLHKVMDQFVEDVDDAHKMFELGSDLAVSVLSSTPPLMDQINQLEAEKMVSAQVGNGVDMFEVRIGKFEEDLPITLIAVRLSDLRAACVVSFALLNLVDGKLYQIEMHDKPTTH